MRRLTLVMLATAALLGPYAQSVTFGARDVILPLRVQLVASGPRCRPVSTCRIMTEAARHYRISVRRFIRTGRCESGLRRMARSGPYRGIFQQHYRYWAARARHAGWPGASIWDVHAQAWVSAWMVRHGGWRSWPVCAYR